MILFTLIALSVLSGSAFVLGFDLLKNWYDIWIILVSYLGFFVAYLIIFILFLLIYTFCISMKKEVKPSRFMHSLIRRVCELLIQVFKIKTYFRGRELLPEEKCLYVANHCSNFDPIIAEWGFRCCDFSFIVKDSLFKVPVVRKALHKDMHLGLDRNNNRQGLEVILKAIKLIKEDKRNIYVYPEGTRSKNGQLAEFHSGTFKIAEKTKAPIVVIVSMNTEEIKRRWFFKSTKVYFDVAKVLRYEDYKDLSTNEISDLVHKIMEDRIKELEELKY